MPQPLIELGGDAVAPVLHIALANGFPPQTYLPLLRPLMRDFRVVCAPPRALWGDETPLPLAEAPDWTQVAADLLAALDHFGLQEVVAVGHSMGGVASMIAAIQQPQRFRALVLLDPTFLTEDIIALLAAAHQMGLSDQHPLAQAASRRKMHFDSAAAFYERYRARPLFADWDDETLRLYAQYGTQSAGTGVQLAWSAAWEAHYFSTGFTATWQTIPLLDGLLPTLILRGDHSDTYTAASAARVAQLLPHATHATIAGGHLFPQSAPQETAEVLQTWLQKTLS